MEIKSYYVETNQGPALIINEDKAEVDLSKKLLVLIDGFGGVNCGEKMAQIILNTLKKSYGKSYSDPNSTMPFFYSSKYLIEGNALINSFHISHGKVLKENDGKKIYNKAGASVLAVAISEKLATVVSCGNCAAFIYRKGRLDFLMAPDSLRDLENESYLNFSNSVPLSGMGLFPELHLQVKEIGIETGDILLLLTDGAYLRQNTSELKFIVEKKLFSEMEILNEIFKQSNERGNLDNQSGIIISF